MIWIFPLIMLILFELIADIFSKEYALKGGWMFWTIALAGYMIANIFWLSSIKNGSGLARGAELFSVGSAVVAIALGLFVFHEKVTNLELVGMILGVIALVLLFWE